MLGGDFLSKQITDFLSDSHNLFSILQTIDETSIVWITNEHHHIVYKNEHFTSLTNTGQDIPLFNIAHIESFHPTLFTVQRGECRLKENEEIWLNYTAIPFYNTVNENYFLWIATDASITKKMELQQHNALETTLRNEFKRTLEHLQNCIFKVLKTETNDFIFTLAEGKLATQLNFTTAYLNKLSPREVFPQKAADKLTMFFEKAFAGNDVHFELELLGAYYFINLSPIYKQQQVVELVGSVVDVTEQKKNENVIYQLAHYDRLTTLPNRAKFQSILEEELHLAKLEQYTCAVLFINLDRFKNINDMFGHTIGDELLIQMAKRLRLALGDEHIIARFGGDEFIVLLKNVTNDDIEQIAKDILASTLKKFSIQHIEMFISLSIGISCFPTDSEHHEELIMKADVAMHHAKSEGKSTYRFFDSQLQSTIQRHLILETALHEALEKKQLSLYFQPKVRSVSGELIGAEALLRWHHPTLGTISPVEFIPIAEETSLIIPIGEWVLEKAVQQLQSWHNKGYPKIILSINVSIKQLTGSDFVHFLATTIEKYAVQPECLQIEITESATMNIQEAMRILNQIKALGVSISIDDFGTGYSSLKYLRHLPIDVLKIDQSFIRDLSEVNKSIIKTIISLAQNMNLSIIAEGVETVEHVSFLKEHMCTGMQGYYFSKPVPTGEFETLLNGQKWKID